MLAMFVPGCTRPAGDKNVRLNQPDGPDHFANQGPVSPFSQGLLGIFAIPEIVKGTKQTLAAIDCPCGEALPGSVDTQGLPGIGVDPVLPTLATGGRPVDGAHSPFVSQVRQQTNVLIVGMRTNVQNSTRRA